MQRRLFRGETIAYLGSRSRRNGTFRARSRAQFRIRKGIQIPASSGLLLRAEQGIVGTLRPSWFQRTDNGTTADQHYYDQAHEADPALSAAVTGPAVEDFEPGSGTTRLAYAARC